MSETTKNNLLEKPSVFQSLSGKFYILSESYDALVFHPQMKYEAGRATFLTSMLGRCAEKIDLKKLRLKSRNQTFAETEPVLIQAFYAAESDAAVPVDQIIVYPNQTIPALMLPVGKFRIRAMDRTGKILNQYKKVNSCSEL